MGNEKPGNRKYDTAGRAAGGYGKGLNTALKDLGDYVVAALPEEVVRTDVAYGELMVTVRASGLIRALIFLRDDTNCRFRVLIDICGVDCHDREPRFDVVSHLPSLSQNPRARTKDKTAKATPLPSSTAERQ